MTTLYASENFDHLNLPHSRRLDAIREFNEAISNKRDQILAILESKNKSIFAHGAVIISTPNNQYISIGLLEIIKGNGVASASPTSQFFCHYFSWLFARSDELGRRLMIERLVSQLSSIQGLYPFFAELEVGFSYLHQGSDVQFIDIGGSNKTTHDITIRKNGIQLNIEVKSVRYDVGLPAPAEALSKALALLGAWCEKNFSPSNPIFALLTLKKSKRLTYKQIEQGITDILARAQAERGTWQNSIFSITISSVNTQDLKKNSTINILDNLVTGATERNYLTIPTDHSKSGCLISLTTEKKLSHISAIKKAVGRAVTQLPLGELRAIHICLYGTGFTLPQELNSFTKQYIFNDNEIRSQFKKADSEFLIGINFSCDSFYAEAENDRNNLSAFPYFQLIANPSCSFLNQYVNIFTPNQKNKRAQSIFFKNHPYRFSWWP